MNIKIIIPILDPERDFFTKNLPMLKKQSIFNSDSCAEKCFRELNGFKLR